MYTYHLGLKAVGEVGHRTLLQSLILLNVTPHMWFARLPHNQPSVSHVNTALVSYMLILT